MDVRGDARKKDKRRRIDDERKRGELREEKW